MTRHDLSVKSLRSNLAVRRDARLKRRSLERQLASYTTESDRLELDAILSRHSAEETGEPPFDHQPPGDGPLDPRLTGTCVGHPRQRRRGWPLRFQYRRFTVSTLSLRDSC
ncbi:hypothetical protein ACVDFE_38760 [Lentzea chajnantorensis]